MEHTQLNLILQDDLHFCRIANRHHAEASKPTLEQQADMHGRICKAFNIGAIIFIWAFVLYWLSTLGV